MRFTLRKQRSASAHSEKESDEFFDAKGDIEKVQVSPPSEQALPPPVDDNTKVQQLKAKLKSLLAKHKGSTKHPDVVGVVNELSKYNPSKKHCARSPKFQGDFFALTSPNFPGRIKSKKGKDDTVQYTLGRLSFRMFQPSTLTCTLRGVRNHVEPAPLPSTETGNESEVSAAPTKFDYSLILDITIHAPGGDIPAMLKNEAYCHEHPDVNNRLVVCFSGATLMPAEEVHEDPAMLKLWAETFEGAYKKAEDQRSYISKLFRYLLRLVLGLSLPTDDLKNTFHFDIKRAPVGYLDVLFMDDDIRITKGNKGTIVVVERCHPNEQ